MRVGLVARSETRGLGIQSFGFAQHMAPEAVLLVDVPDGHDKHPEWYPGAFHAHWRPGTDRLYGDVAPFLDACDVIWSAETLYGWSQLTRRPAVVQGNPELWRHATRPLPHPAEWWWPTPWRLDQLAAGPVVPYPVDDDPPAHAADPYQDGPLVVAHPGGWPAMADRNGTLILSAAAKAVRRSVRIRVWTQAETLANSVTRGSSRMVDWSIVCGTQPDRWRVYDGAHVVVIPRRYGGLCLPAQEALAAGCALIMTDCSPNGFWPGPRIPARRTTVSRMAGGAVQLYEASANRLAALIDHLAVHRDDLAAAQAEARAWAAGHRWSVWRPRYRERLAAVAASAGIGSARA